MMTFLNPLNALSPKILFSFFLPNVGSRSPLDPGGQSRWDFGGPSIEPSLVEDGSSQRAVSTPPPHPQRPPTPGAFLLSSNGVCVCVCVRASVRMGWWVDVC